MTNNAEKVKPEVEIELKGKTRRLIFDVNAACLIEQVLGREVFTGEVFKRMGFTEVRAFLWGMLRTFDPSLTIEQAGGLISRQNMPEVLRAIVDAYKRGMPEADEAKSVGEAEAKNEEAPAA